MNRFLILISLFLGNYIYAAISAAATASTAGDAGGREGFFTATICQNAIEPTSSSISAKLASKIEYERIAGALYQFYPLAITYPIDSVRNIVSHLGIQYLNIGNLAGYVSIMEIIIENFGPQYESLLPEEKIAFCVARGVDAFFKGDMINASAFLLEARQINIMKSEGLDFSILSAALYDLRLAIDERSGMSLTEEQTQERLLLKLCFSKLLESSHAADTRKTPEVFLMLAHRGSQERLVIKQRNPILYGHLVYLTAQYAVGKILHGKRINHLDEVLNLILSNLDFFQGDSIYREEGQRLYLCVIGTVIPQFFDRAFLILKAFADQKHTGIVDATSTHTTVVCCPDKTACLDRIIQYAILRQERFPEDFFTTIEQTSANLPVAISIVSQLKELLDQVRFAISREEENELRQIS